MLDFKDYLKEKQEIVNSALDRLIADSDLLHRNRLLEAMRYSCLAGGKRIRPILCLSTAAAIGNCASDEILTTACALEFVHTYSLIHDDLPAMDDDALRRGNPTCHIQFDEATAILAGDGLLTFAFDILSDLGCRHPENCQNYMQVIQLLADAAGHKGMVKGQWLDLESEGKTVSLEALKTIHKLKTGKMIIASVISGALLANADAFQLKHLESYAKNIGLAFQVMDDILNIEGDPQVMGKSVGTDMQRDKCTYPALMGLDASKEFAADLINNALDAVDTFDHKADRLREIAAYIINRNK